MSNQADQPDNENTGDDDDGLLPVTLLAGFLGAGKTTLLKHVLESPHDGMDFRCAVIVNDVAELNIDKALIDTSFEMTHSDSVISMQNGCVCCTLAEDLKSQIIELAQRKENGFNYMLIEASGVSEPEAIAQIFEPCKDPNHDHTHGNGHAAMDHHSLQLNEVARLDTCVTVVAADQFYQNLETVVKGKSNNFDDEDITCWPILMTEQIEYANVVILNKTDLVSSSQRSSIEEQIAILNPTAKVLSSRNAVVDISQVLHTRAHVAGLMGVQPTSASPEDSNDRPGCCAAAGASESPCCRRARTRRTELSTVMLSPKAMAMSRHTSRFGITSFTYTAWRPFHPKRFNKNFAEKYFVLALTDDDDDDDYEDDEEEDENDLRAKMQEDDLLREETQKLAMEKQKCRTESLGNLLRTKGFLWMPHAHDIKGEMSHAGNMMKFKLEETWNVLDARAYSSFLNAPEEDEKMKATKRKKYDELRKDWVKPYGDRRQELVFIGQNLKHDVIQAQLDECLLDDYEYAMGVDAWKATFGDIFLDAGDYNRVSGFDDDNSVGGN